MRIIYILSLLLASLAACSRPATTESESTTTAQETPATEPHAGSALPAGWDENCSHPSEPTVLVEVHLSDGRLVLSEGARCHLLSLLSFVAESRAVQVELEFPETPSRIVAEAGKRESEPEVDFAKYWHRHVSETEVGLLRLASMMQGVYAPELGTLERYRARMLTAMEEGTLSRQVAESLADFVEQAPDLEIISSEGSVPKGEFLEQMESLAEGEQIDRVAATVILNRHLGAGRDIAAIPTDLAVLALERYVLLRADRAFANMYGAVRIDDVKAMGASWESFVDSAIERRDFSTSAALVDSMLDGEVMWFECGGSALPGFPHNYGRFLVPTDLIAGTVWGERMRTGPWPIGAASEIFSPEEWARYAGWQMLARESKLFADGMSIYRDDLYRCGPP